MRTRSYDRPHWAILRRRMSDASASDFTLAVEEVLDVASSSSDFSPNVEATRANMAACCSTGTNTEEIDLEWNAASSGNYAGDEADCGEGIVRSVPTMRAECRICQDEDYVHRLETPCACNGTLKFAHRHCVQKWCTRKGSIRCEICKQLYTPGYTAPPSAAECFAIEIRQSWATHMGRSGAFDRDYEDEEEDADDDDEGRDFGPTFAGIACCRIAAVLLMLVLFIRHALMVMANTSLLQDPDTYFNFAGFLLPMYCMVQFLRMIYRRKVRENRRAAAAAAAAVQRRQE